MLPNLSKLCVGAVLTLSAGSALALDTNVVDDCLEKYGPKFSSTQSITDRERADLLNSCLQSAKLVLSSKLEVARLQAELEGALSGNSVDDNGGNDIAPPPMPFNPGFGQGEVFSAPKPTTLVRTFRLEGERTGQAIISVNGEDNRYTVGDEIENGWQLAGIELNRVRLIKNIGGKERTRFLKMKMGSL